MALQHENTRARRQALQLLYQRELMELGEEGECPLYEALVISEWPEGAEEDELVGERIRAYATQLADGVQGEVARIDSWIAATAQNWKLERMPIVDRNIIRIAAFEIAFCDDIPTGVAINEAVEVAKSFGGDDSPKFVNGVLGRLADLVESGEADEVAQRAALAEQAAAGEEPEDGEASGADGADEADEPDEAGGVPDAPAGFDGDLEEL